MMHLCALQALVCCKAAQRAPVFYAADDHLHQSCSLPLRCSLWQTEQSLLMQFIFLRCAGLRREHRAAVEHQFPLKAASLHQG